MDFFLAEANAAASSLSIVPEVDGAVGASAKNWRGFLASSRRANFLLGFALGSFGADPLLPIRVSVCAFEIEDIEGRKSFHLGVRVAEMNAGSRPSFTVTSRASFSLFTSTVFICSTVVNFAKLHFDCSLPLTSVDGSLVPRPEPAFSLNQALLQLWHLPVNFSFTIKLALVRRLSASAPDPLSADSRLAAAHPPCMLCVVSAGPSVRLVALLS